MRSLPGQPKLKPVLRSLGKLPIRFALLIAGTWLFLALAANALQPQAWTASNSSPLSMLPSGDSANAAATRSGVIFDGTGSDAIASVVFEGSRPLTAGDHAYYDAIVEALQNDRAHVTSALGMWSDPLTATAAESKDYRASYAMMWLAGEVGSSQARDSATAARAIVAGIAAPDGIQAVVAGPATTMGAPLDVTGTNAATLCGLIVLAIAVMAALACRALLPTGIALLTGALPCTIAVPITYWASTALSSGMSVFCVPVVIAFSMGAGTEFALLFLRGRRDLFGDNAASTIGAIGTPVAVMSGLAGLAPNPTMRALAVPAAIGVTLAMLAGITLLPALVALVGERLPAHAAASPPAGSPESAARRPTAALICLVLAVLASMAPVVTGRFDDEAHRDQIAAGAEHFPPSQFLPSIAVIESGHDLRTPSGLIAIDRLTRRLMEMPGVRMVQSASWPGGSPWSEATVAHQAGTLASQLQDQVSAFVPQINAIKALAVTIDQVSAAVNDLERSMAQGAQGLKRVESTMGSVKSGAKDIQDAATALSANLDPVRHWMSGVANCPGDFLCSALLKVTDPVDSMINSIGGLSDDVGQIAAGAKVATDAFATAPASVGRMKTALASFKGLVSSFRGTIEEVLPQVIQLSAYLRNISADFGDSGEGIFYLSQKTINAPSYEYAKRLLFSPDGRSTRLFVYGYADSVAAGSALHAAEISQAIAASTKYGALTDSKATITGTAAIAQSLYRNALVSVMALVGALAVGVLIAAGFTRSLRLSALSGVLAGICCVAALGLNIAFWQYLVADSVDRTAALAACALVTPFAFAHNIALLTGAARSRTAALTVAGLGLGIGLLVVATSSQKDVGQIGMMVVAALVIDIALARLCRVFVAEGQLP